jgi:hypothetical protein
MSDERRSSNKFKRQSSIVLADAFRTVSKSPSIFPEIMAAIQVEPVEMPALEQDFVSDRRPETQLDPPSISKVQQKWTTEVIYE